MFETLPLSPWQRVFLWPGGAFLDWLARTWPEIVIVHGFGFTTESYVFWAAVISLGFWFLALLAVSALLQRLLRRMR